MPVKKKRASFSKHEEPVEASPVDPEALREVHIDPVPEVATPEKGLEEMLQLDVQQESSLSKKNKVLYSVGIISAILVIALSMAIYGLYISSQQESKTPVVKSSAPVVTQTPAPVFSPTTISVEVLNGSGVSGAAAKAAATLTKQGYRVVSTGNAKKIPVSTVLLSSAVNENDAQAFLKDIREIFGLSSSSGVLTGSTASARLTLGAD